MSDTIHLPEEAPGRLVFARACSRPGGVIARDDEGNQIPAPSGLSVAAMEDWLEMMGFTLMESRSED